MSGFSTPYFGNPLPAANGGTGNTGGAWTATAPAVTGNGTPGTFAATCAMRTLQEGKRVTLSIVVTVTNAGTASSYQVPLPVTPQGSIIVPGTNGSGVGHLGYNYGGANLVFSKASDGATAPAVATYYYNGVYEAA